ncbi:N-acetylmuramoyl-L-alanine amidase [Lentibacillus persicus]|uniref:N-acetylmuramoyl-L-alanine amidase n=1 Tax=Lentibacillus persicus TaxID=640948 RepID=A0A1I1U635_9BACI|nr:N-acetylmuramoyl-L-alanine amidase [Lentibacillus persicus]SFD66239.1 N-acetylmuramoyl-L-alanine amidase [Lentibacillus persicus]
MGTMRTFITAIGFILFFTIFTPTVMANDGDTYQVGTDGLNVRTAPSNSAAVVGQLNSGDQVVVFQKEHGWAQTYYDGQVVWVAAHYLYQSGGGEAVTTTSQAGSESSSQSPEPASTASGTLNGYNIILDPGHGGNDPGAIGLGGTLEKNFTLKTAETVAQKLRDAGATVLMTRSDDKYVSLAKRVDISRSYATDAFISLHYNAYPLEGVNGFSTYYHTNGDDRELAASIQSGLKGNMALNSRGLMQNGYHVLRNNSDLAVLAELGFITNPYDLSVIQTSEHRQNVADGIAEGVLNYFNN